METIIQPTYNDYLTSGFSPVLCKGYHPVHNDARDYATAKVPAFRGWTDRDYMPPSLEDVANWEKEGGWTGWKPPKGVIVLDVDKGADDIDRVRGVCRAGDIEPGIHRTNNGLHFFFRTDKQLSGASRMFVKCGLDVTYRVAVKNQVILAPVNGRTWELWRDPKDLSALPDEFLPYDRKNLDDVLNCLVWQVKKAYQAGYFSGYEDVDAAFMALLIECRLSGEQVHHAFEIIFGQDYDECRTDSMYERARTRIENGEPLVGAGSFVQRVKEQGLLEVQRFVRELQAVTGAMKGKKNTEGAKHETLSETLIEIATALPLFHDDDHEAYAQVDGQIVMVRSNKFKEFLARILWHKEKKTANREAVAQALDVIAAQAVFEGPLQRLHNRVASHEGAFYYDLADGRVVKTTPSGWEITNAPLLFKNYSHQQAQVEPARGGNVHDLLNYLNIADEQHRLLVLTSLISAYIPDISHPIQYPHGAQGSGKTTLGNVMKRLVDPSSLAVLLSPKDKNETVQLLSHHYLNCFDNVSNLPPWLSDLLSQACTGGGISKRKLYSDDDDIIYQIKRCIIVNGINMLVTKPDLMDRMILLHHDRIEPRKRLSEREFWEEFEKQRPYILGSIFDVLSRAMAIHPQIHLGSLPRMADFAIWGCAIAEALGYKQVDFLDAYQANMNTQTAEIIEGNTLAQAVIRLMSYHNKWDNTVKNTYEQLRLLAYPDVAREKSVPRDDGTFPKAPNKLRRQLERLRPNLLDYGITFTIAQYHAEDGTRITIERIEQASSEDPRGDIPPDDHTDDRVDSKVLSTKELEEKSLNEAMQFDTKAEKTKAQAHNNDAGGFFDHDTGEFFNIEPQRPKKKRPPKQPRPKMQRHWDHHE